MNESGRSATKPRNERRIGGEQTETIRIGSGGDVDGENEMKGVHESASGGRRRMRLACEDLCDFLANRKKRLLDLGVVSGFARERSEDAILRRLGGEGGEELGVKRGLESMERESFVEATE